MPLSPHSSDCFVSITYVIVHLYCFLTFVLQLNAISFGHTSLSCLWTFVLQLNAISVVTRLCPVFEHSCYSSMLYINWSHVFVLSLNIRVTAQCYINWTQVFVLSLNIRVTAQCYINMTYVFVLSLNIRVTAQCYINRTHVFVLSLNVRPWCYFPIAFCGQNIFIEVTSYNDISDSYVISKIYRFLK